MVNATAGITIRRQLASQLIFADSSLRLETGQSVRFTGIKTTRIEYALQIKHLLKAQRATLCTLAAYDSGIMPKLLSQLGY